MDYKGMDKEIKKKLEEFYGFECPDFSVEVCESRKDFEEKTGKRETPEWLVGFTNNGKIHILSPKAMERESSHKKEEFEQILTHEICHIFHYQINKNILTWVDEGVALFVAGQNKNPDFTKEDLKKFFNGPFDPEKGYRIAYWAIKTVFDLGGKEMVLELAKVDKRDPVRESKIDQIIGMKKDEFVDRVIEYNKITKFEAIKISKDFLEIELEKEEWFIKVKPFIKAFVLYGSVAKETNRADSDIDIMIILPLEQEEKYTKGEYFYDYKGFKINIVLRSIEKLRKIASEGKDSFQKEVFDKSEILMDTDGEVTALLKKIEKI